MNIIEQYFHNPTKDNLKFLLRNSDSHIYKARAAHHLLGMNPSNNELCLIIETAPQRWSIIGANQLFNQNPNGEQLCFILKHGMEESQVKASKIILEKLPYSEYLLCIIKNAPFPLKIEAAKKLLEKDELENHELQNMIMLKHSIGDQAIEKAFNFVLNNQTLKIIIDHGNDTQKSRAQEILNKRFFRKRSA